MNTPRDSNPTSSLGSQESNGGHKEFFEVFRTVQMAITI